MAIISRVLALLLLLLTPAIAAPHGRAINGQAVLNLGSGDVTVQSTVNLFKTAQMSFSGGATPAALDADLYPVQNFSGLISGTLGEFNGILQSVGPYTMDWPAGRSCFKITFVANVASATNKVNVTTTGGGGATLTVNGDGVHAGSLDITFSNTNTVTYQIAPTDTPACNYNVNTSGDIRLYLKTSASQANANIWWTSPMTYLIGSLHPVAIRPMGWNLPSFGTYSTLANWNYRTQTSNFSFFPGGTFPPGTRCGGGASFCSISATNGQYTAAVPDDSSHSTWVQGETITGNITSTTAALTTTSAIDKGLDNNCRFTIADTSILTVGNPVVIDGLNGALECLGNATIAVIESATKFTINKAWTVNGDCNNTCYIGYQTLTKTGTGVTAPPKVIVGDLTRPIGLGFDTDQTSISTGNATFVYDAVIDRVILTPGGIRQGPPLEAQAQLANLVGADLWYNFPQWADDTFVTNAANTIYANLTKGLHTEFSNEVWNSGFAQFFWATQRGLVLGVTTYTNATNGGSSNGYVSLRTRQINGNLLPASNWSGALSRLDRSVCWQAAVDSGTLTSLLNGSVIYAANAFPGNAAFQAYVGGGAPNYSTAPNRPSDVTNSACYAPYVTGFGLAGSLDGACPAWPSCNIAVTANSVANIQAIVNAQGAGNTSLAASLVDTDIKNGQGGVQTVTCNGTTTLATPSAHNFIVGEFLRFSVTGGTICTGISATALYKVLTIPLSTTWTMCVWVNNGCGSTVTATAGSGTTSVADTGRLVDQGFYIIAGGQAPSWQGVVTAINADGGRPGAIGSMNLQGYEGNLEPWPWPPKPLATAGVTGTTNFTFTGTTSNGSATVTALSRTDMAAGSTITGAGIPDNCLVASVNTGASSLILGTAADDGTTSSGIGCNATASATVTLTSDDAYMQFLNALNVSWKNSDLARKTTMAYFNMLTGQDSNSTTFGNMPNARYPAWLVLMAGGQYAFNQNDSFVAPSLYRTYYGFQTYSTCPSPPCTN